MMGQSSNWSYIYPLCDWNHQSLPIILITHGIINGPLQTWAFSLLLTATKGSGWSNKLQGPYCQLWHSSLSQVLQRQVRWRGGKKSYFLFLHGTSGYFPKLGFLYTKIFLSKCDSGIFPGCDTHSCSLCSWGFSPSGGWSWGQVTSPTTRCSLNSSLPPKSQLNCA